MVSSKSKIQAISPTCRKFKEEPERFHDEYEQMNWKVQSEGKLAKNSLTMKRQRFGRAFVDRTPLARRFIVELMHQVQQAL